MTLIDKIDKMTLEGTYGKPKSPEYIKMMKQIQDATDDKQLTAYLKSMEVKMKGKLITQDEMLNLIDLIDKKKSIGGGKVKKLKPKKFK